MPLFSAWTTSHDGLFFASCDTAAANRAGWQVWSERGFSRFKIQTFDSKALAQIAFEREWFARILVDPDDVEARSSSGCNLLALARVRRANARWRAQRRSLTRVIVHSLTGAMIEVPTSARATIADVKLEISRIWDTECERQSLVHEATVSADHDMVSSMLQRGVENLHLTLVVKSLEHMENEMIEIISRYSLRASTDGVSEGFAFTEMAPYLRFFARHHSRWEFLEGGPDERTMLLARFANFM